MPEHQTLLEFLPATTDLNDDVVNELENFVSHNSKLSFEGAEDCAGWLAARDMGSMAMMGCVGYAGRENRVYLMTLCVNKDARRQGIGRALAEGVYNQVVETGETLFALTDGRMNSGFYRSLGYEHLKPASEYKKLDDIAGRKQHRFCTVYAIQK